MSTNNGDPVPAVTEAAATGEIAASYADIRATFGVGVVNLVWRHLATIPGALPWCWAAVKPLYVDGTVPAEADMVRRALPLPALPVWPVESLEAVGVDAAGRQSIARIVDSYNQTNPMALVALTALSLRLDGGPIPAPTIGARLPIPTIDGPLPRLLAASEMAPATAALVTTIDALGQLAMLASDGRLGSLIETALALGRRGAERIAGALAPPSTPLDAATAAAARQGLNLFTRMAIARMTPIGALLRRTLPA